MKETNSIFVSELLKRENNNLDLFRIIAACMVIVGHSYGLFPSVGELDQIKQFVGFTYSGALAVKIFFFISGLVVTNSILTSNSAGHFVISRFFRIFPALIFLCLMCALVIGPIVSTMSTSEYFSSPLIYEYIKNNITLKAAYFLPGLFAGNPYPNVVNGALWTLPYEVGCYLFLLGIFCVGILKNRLVGSIILGIVIIESMIPYKIFTQWLGDSSDIMPLPACFSIGAILALNKEKVKINYLQTVGFITLTYLLWGTRFMEMFFYISVFSLILNLSGNRFLRKLKIKNDISYGIYLWGFVVQQVLQNYVHGQTVYLKMFLAAAIAMAVAYVSWIVVEKNSIRLGKYLITKLNLTKSE